MEPINIKKSTPPHPNEIINELKQCNYELCSKALPNSYGSTGVVW